MRLHELKENKIYIGEDGIEYKILDNHLCYLDGIGVIVATSLSILTQDFTPKKTKKTMQLSGFVNIYPTRHGNCVHATKEEADFAAYNDRIACVYITGSYEIEVEE